MVVAAEFEDFARGFRERTEQRLLQFEKALAKAQDELEKSAEKATEQARREGAVPGRQASSGMAPHAASRESATDRRRINGADMNTAPARRSGSRQVQSVLRRK